MTGKDAAMALAWLDRQHKIDLEALEALGLEPYTKELERNKIEDKYAAEWLPLEEFQYQDFLASSFCDDASCFKCRRGLCPRPSRAYIGADEIPFEF